MTDGVARKIVKAANGHGLKVRIIEGYSGKSMYGSATTGLAYTNVGHLLASVVLAARDESNGAGFALQMAIVLEGVTRTALTKREFIVY